ncbi:MAG: PEP-utilizing enzyme [bacterium]|nr:PEP-utilizing enzyme [bacterium]
MRSKKIILRGQSACGGTAEGTVRIISGDVLNDEMLVKDLEKVKEGDILVTTMTRPLFVMVMRKVKAIVTDKGGVLCHAAMVSREFGIPCVVGTKAGTKILKDGQRVLVNANEGLIYEI